MKGSCSAHGETESGPCDSGPSYGGWKHIRKPRVPGSEVEKPAHWWYMV
jgi:hypothetical protein